MAHNWIKIPAALNEAVRGCDRPTEPLVPSLSEEQKRLSAADLLLNLQMSQSMDPSGAPRAWALTIFASSEAERAVGQSSDPKLPDLKKVQKFFPHAEAVAKVRKKGKQYFTAYFPTRAQALHDRLTCARKMAARKTDKLMIDYLDSGTVEEGAWKAR